MAWNYQMMNMFDMKKTQMKTNSDEKSVVSLVDQLLLTAIDRAVSDIHLEPLSDKLRVRFRIDGMLHDQKPIDENNMQQVVSRLKVLASMNIAQKRIPQDGTFTMIVNREPIDLRVSTFPSFFGEKMVVRILDRNAQMLSLDQLGFSRPMLDQFKQLLNRPNGFLLVTGPTGSGKTTSLYAALSALHTADKNIVTLEDPIEYHLEGITQGQINPQAGFTFEHGIRSVLRQDPDILLVGEIRDKQTAKIAIEAALTGHVVLSTLHTNDAASAIMRLMDMGIEPYLINAAVTGVLAQRLGRKICSACKEEYSPTELDQVQLKKMNINLNVLYRGKGCDQCNYIGNKGRVGIFELLTVTQPLRTLIVKQPSFDAIRAQALIDGLCVLAMDAQQKLREGVISLDELVRIV